MDNSEVTDDDFGVIKRLIKLEFAGKGGTYFSVVIVNWLLTVVTLGLYYPWAKEKQLKYLYSHAKLNNDSFSFNGTGKEMFIGFIKTILLFGLLFSIPVVFALLEMPFIGLALFYAIFLFLIPLIIHGSYRYRMSRTSWRGIRFGYRGEKLKLGMDFFKWVLLTLLTLGIYGAWLVVNLRTYIISNIRLGQLKFKYEGSGGDLLLINIKGYFLSIFTFGIYWFWWQKDRFEFFVNGISIHNENEKLTVKSTATGFDIFKLMIGNVFILIFTLGIGYPWVVIRKFNFAINNIVVEGDVDLDKIIQTEENYTDALGEDMGDFFDFDLVM